MVDEKSLTSVKLQSVIEYFFFNSFETVFVTFLLMSLKTFVDVLLISIVFTSVLLEGLKFMQSQLRLVFHTRNYNQKRLLEMCEVDI